MIKVAVFGIVASLIAMKIKTIRPEIAVVIAVISSILLAMYGLKQMEEILTVFDMIRSYSKIPQSYFQILLKLIGISFICEFASNICKDAGQASIAKQIEFAGKLAILIVGLPVFESLLTRDVKDTVYERIHYIAEQRGFRILEINGEPDHIHILMEVDAITSLAELANVLKTQTARRARKLYGETLLKKYYWKPYFWSDSYFITTVSENSLKVVKQYIQNQGKR